MQNQIKISEIVKAKEELKIISQAYCTRENENKVLDPELLFAIQDIIAPILARKNVRIEELEKQIKEA